MQGCFQFNAGALPNLTALCGIDYIFDIYRVPIHKAYTDLAMAHHMQQHFIQAGQTLAARSDEC